MLALTTRRPLLFLKPIIENSRSELPNQKTKRRMLTFMMTPMANIIEARAEPP